MKKTHMSYLRRIIGHALADRSDSSLSDAVLSIKTPSSVEYQMMRDIVCDARFYSVLDNDAFWKSYGAFKILRFLDAIPSSDWNSEESVTMLKEDFLNSWLADHIFPLSEEQRKEIIAGIKVSSISDDGVGMPDPDSHDGSSLGVIFFGRGIKDATDRTGVPADGLPPELKDFMDDAYGGASSGLHNDGHKAEVTFLERIDSSIVELAEKIGRRGGPMQVSRGKFRPASKSDITGVTVGDDLNSILPSDLALLASPITENIFLDRLVRKRLQIFSSASRTCENNEKSGPILLCIDTSGSMVGLPETFAKTLAFSVCMVAQKYDRPVCIFNYSDSISFFVLKNIKRQRKRLLRFLSDSYGGGNDENKLFRFLFGRMPKMSRYRDVIAEFKYADLLLVSDFRWDRIMPDARRLLDSSRRRGMRVFTVSTDCQSGHYGLPLKSDFPYSFEDGRIKEIVP